jgi:MFS family permease
MLLGKLRISPSLVEKNGLKEFSVYQEYYSVHQLSSQTPSTISWIGSIQVFFLFAGSLFGGPLFDRYGAKVRHPYPPTPFPFTNDLFR